MDNINKYNMTKKEIDTLAQLVVDKLLVNFGIEEYKELQNRNALREDEEETVQRLHHQILSDLIMGTESEYFINEEEMLIGEMARLQTILMIYENNEEYEKAAIVLSKLKSVQHKLKSI